MDSPRSLEDAAMMILSSDGIDFDGKEAKNEKIDANAYSVKTVPKGLIDVTLEKFFSSLQNTVDKYKDYQLQSDEEILDYFKMKRFLFTAFNNILELDSSLADGTLMEMYRNIQEVNGIHDTYKKSYMYPKIAFSNIFLKYTKYKEAKARLQRNIKEMDGIKGSLSIMESDIKYNLQKIAEAESNETNAEDLKFELKRAKRHYVDSIDKMGTLREENDILIPITNEYFEVFFENFTQKFENSYQKNIKAIIAVLDSMAFFFDRLMWERASYSRIIRRHFKEAGVTYPYSSLTFLRYYLKTLDKNKLNQENRELFELLEYLEKRNKK